MLYLISTGQLNKILHYIYYLLYFSFTPERALYISAYSRLQSRIIKSCHCILRPISYIRPMDFDELKQATLQLLMDSNKL